MSRRCITLAPILETTLRRVIGRFLVRILWSPFFGSRTMPGDYEPLREFLVEGPISDALVEDTQNLIPHYLKHFHRAPSSQGHLCFIIAFATSCNSPSSKGPIESCLIFLRKAISNNVQDCIVLPNPVRDAGPGLHLPRTPPKHSPEERKRMGCHFILGGDQRAFCIYEFMNIF